MTRVEFYNAAVSVYEETGQGVPGFSRIHMPDGIIEGLIKEGLLKSVITRYSHLPDDETLCITKGYCVEEDINKSDLSALHYLRLYKGIEQELSGVGFPDNAKLIQDPGFMKGYSEWLTKNHAKLIEPVERLVED